MKRKKFQIRLSRMIEQTAQIEVEAVGEAEARREAAERAESGEDLGWENIPPIMHGIAVEGCEE